MLALGVTPTGMVRHDSFESGSAPWVEAALGKARPEIFDGATGLPFEKIAALRPDLIVATDDYGLADNFARLSQIAPTVSYVDGVESDTWQQRATHIGQALGREAATEQLIVDITAKVMEAALANPGFAGKTLSYFYASQGEIRAITGGDAGLALLRQLGLTISPKLAGLPQADSPGRSSVSPENIGLLDADVMLASYPTDADRTFFESNPLVPRLNAVRGGTYVIIDQPVSVALAFPSVLSIPYALDRTVTAIADALA